MLHSLHFPVQTGHHRVSFHDGFDDPRGGGRHCGVDIGSSEGTLIYSATLGTVVNGHMLGGGRPNPARGGRPLPWSGSDTSPRSGNFVIIADFDGYFYFYAHMRTSLVQAGQVVSSGQTIGHMGNTGLGGGNGPVHLHFQVWSPFQHAGNQDEYRQMSFRRRFGRAVNPFEALKTAALQIPGAALGRGRVGQRLNVEGVIIRQPTPGQLQHQREIQDAELDELMIAASGSGSYLHN